MMFHPHLSTALVVLKKARELLTNHWTKGYFAKTADGQWVSPLSNSATCFCAVGAIQRCVFDPKTGLSNAELRTFAESLSYKALQEQLNKQGLTGKYGHIPGFNDSQTEAAPVLELFDKAIKDVEQTIELGEPQPPAFSA